MPPGHRPPFGAKEITKSHIMEDNIVDYYGVTIDNYMIDIYIYIIYIYIYIQLDNGSIFASLHIVHVDGPEMDPWRRKAGESPLLFHDVSAIHHTAQFSLIADIWWAC
jgi:hypothetical protein